MEYHGKKTDFNTFQVGTIFNPIQSKGKVGAIGSEIILNYPSRLEAMSLDPSQIVQNNNLIYPAGQINFSVDITKKVRVRINKASNKITISQTSPRPSLIRHAALIMQEALEVNDGLDIDVIDEVNLRHCGLGSSSSLIASVATAINELYGCPLTTMQLIRYCAQNHGEEIDGADNCLMPVQCIGGSGACGHFEGGLVIIAGLANPIYLKDLPENLSVVIGVPKDFKHPDSQTMMRAEIDNINGFKRVGKEYSQTIAYRVLHQVIPAAQEGNLRPLKELIFDYRWDMGGIQNCTFAYPGITDLAERLRHLRTDDEVKILSLSSVGPGFFALTSNTEKVKTIFEKLDMKTIVTRPHNASYQILSLT
ncbi:MAG TPA: hypothetical protein VLG40_04045 [Candidatus Saccharimonas sp.]|nr:hypothetical protein [Candidatus Saccharimonas sp.]